MRNARHPNGLAGVGASGSGAGPSDYESLVVQLKIRFTCGQSPSTGRVTVPEQTRTL